MACLDTTVLVDLLRRRDTEGHRSAAALLARLAAGGQQLTTTRFNVAEMLAGVERHSDPIAARQRLDDLLEGIRILDFDALACERYGKVAAHLARRGTPIGDMDMLIAATALVNDQGICSRNSAHFRLVPGLSVEEY